MQQVYATNVVVGAGAMGSAAAYHLAKLGEPVLLLEQFELGHDRGSSHGAARITRHSYADPDYARLMPDAFRAWRELEADAGRNLYLRTGGVSFCPGGVDYVGRVTASLESLGVPHRRMTAAELRRDQPAFQVPEDTEAVFEPDAGMIAAATALATQVELARRFGGESTRVLDRCPVRRIDLEADRPTLVTDRLRIVADRLIVTAGAWVSRLLPDLPVPLRPTRQQVLYFRAPDPAPFSPGRFPVFIYKGREDADDFYGMPEFLGMGVKVARHGGPEVDPDEVDRSVGEEYRQVVRRFLRTYLPALAEAGIDRTEVCLYTLAPEDRFQIGSLAVRPDVFVASPCSGHGFKFSCLIGQVLADLATRGQTDVAIEPWRFRESAAPPAS
jgi:sarcosine oxidase